MIRPPVVLVIILVGLSGYFQTGSCENSALEDQIEIISAELGIPEWKVRKFLNVMNQRSGKIRNIRSKYSTYIEKLYFSYSLKATMIILKTDLSQDIN